MASNLSNNNDQQIIRKPSPRPIKIWQVMLKKFQKQGYHKTTRNDLVEYCEGIEGFNTLLNLNTISKSSL